MRISDWSSDVCSSDLVATIFCDDAHLMDAIAAGAQGYILKEEDRDRIVVTLRRIESDEPPLSPSIARRMLDHFRDQSVVAPALVDLSARETETLALIARGLTVAEARSEEHTSELQSLMRISYAVFCLKKKKKR